MFKLQTFAISAAGAMLGSMPASAAVVTYSGQDIMSTTTSPHPNSSAAAAAFDAAVAGAGGGSLVNFEASPLGSFSSLTIAPGVTISGTDYQGNNQTIRNTTNFAPAPTLDGYNTTPAGAQFVEVIGGTLTFTFATPVNAFGAYFSGIQTAFFADFITFSDGTTQTLLLPGTGTSNSVGALDFVGFTDFGKSVVSVTLNAGSASLGADAIGVDDVRFARASATVPELSSWAMMIGGLGLVGVAMRYRKVALSAA